MPIVENIDPEPLVEELCIKAVALPADVLGAVARDLAETQLPDAPNIPAAVCTQPRCA